MDVATVTPRIVRIPVVMPPVPGAGPGVFINSTVSGPHYYQQKTWVGSVSRGATVEAVFEALRRFATPWQGGVRINETGDKTVIPYGGGPVQHVVDPERLTIVNTTLPGHVLHPGNVFRKVVQEGDDIYIFTEGYGQGILPEANKFVAPYLWYGTDLGVRKELNSGRSSAPASQKESSFGGIEKDGNGQKVITTGIVLPNSTVIGVSGPASVSGNTASFATSNPNVSLTHPTGTTVQYALGSAQLDVAANGNATVTVAGANGGPTRNIILDQPTGNVAINPGSAPGASYTAVPGSVVTLGPSSKIDVTGFNANNSRPWSWRDTVLDSQNRPIRVLDHPGWDRVGNGQTQVQQIQEHARNSQPIGEPVQQGRRPSDDRAGAEPLAESPPLQADFYRDPLADERASNADPMPEADAVRDDAESSRQQQAIDRAASRQQAVAAHLARIDEAKQRIPDFDQVIRSGGQVPIAPGVADEILNSEKSALLQYHLAGNPAKLAELNGLSGLNLAREIGRLEGRLYLPTARTEASPPLSDVRGGAAPIFDPHKTDDMDAFANWLREDQARRRRA